MKKLISIFMTITVLFSVSGMVSAKNGICGEVLNTDIKAYINGNPIRSYNIDGWTGVVAEDLRDYGFVVEWSAQNRTLYIGGEGFTDTPTHSYQFTQNTKPIGSVASYVYETDIKTYVNGKIVNAFNIGGFTIIYIDDLQAFGDVLWNEEKREISYTYRTPWTITYNPYMNGEDVRHELEGTLATDGIKSMKATFTKNADGSFDVTGENIGHFSWIDIVYNKRYGGLQVGFSMVAHHLLADDDFSELCWEMITNFNDGTPITKTTDLANKHTKIYINDVLVNIKEVRLDRGNNHRDTIFVLDYDIAKEDIYKVEIECGL